MFKYDTQHIFAENDDATSVMEKAKSAIKESLKADGLDIGRLLINISQQSNNH